MKRLTNKQLMNLAKIVSENTHEHYGCLAHNRNQIFTALKYVRDWKFRSISPDVEPEGKTRHISEIFKAIK